MCDYVQFYGENNVLSCFKIQIAFAAVLGCVGATIRLLSVLYARRVKFRLPKNLFYTLPPN